MELVKNRMEIKTRKGSCVKESSDNGFGDGEVMLVLLNDDITPMAYVVVVLNTIFGFDEDLSYVIMMAVHQTGSAVLGYYSEEEALQLLSELDAENSLMGERLRCIMLNWKNELDLNL